MFYVSYPSKGIQGLEKYCLYTERNGGSNEMELFLARTRNLKKNINVPLSKIKSMRI